MKPLASLARLALLLLPACKPDAPPPTPARPIAVGHRVDPPSPPPFARVPPPASREPACTVTLSLEGMQCGGICTRRPRGVLFEVPGVTAVDIDFDRKEAVVKGSRCDVPAMVAALTQAGYRAALK